MQVDGSCHCGKIAYRAEVDPEKTSLCHCSTSVAEPKIYFLRMGSIRQRAQLPPRRQIWCRSALPWSANLEGVPKMEREPGR